MAPFKTEISVENAKVECRFIIWTGYSISHPSEYNIIESINEVPIDLPKRDFIEWLRFAPRKETKSVVNQTTSSVRNHRLYVFVDDGNTKRPHFVELLISNDGTRAVFYQSK